MRQMIVSLRSTGNDPAPCDPDCGQEWQQVDDWDDLLLAALLEQANIGVRMSSEDEGWGTNKKGRVNTNQKLTRQEN